MQNLKAICLDTRILSAFLKGKATAQKIVLEFIQKGYEVYTTTVNIAEYFWGAYKVNQLTETKQKELQDFFATLHPRELDYKASVLAGKLNATVLRGQEIGWRDLFIGTIVLLNGKQIISSNKDHFERVPDLKVIEYR